MDQSLEEGRVFAVVSANFGGAARDIALSKGGSRDRPEALGEFVTDPTGDGRLKALPVIAGIQEVARTGGPDAHQQLDNAQFLGSRGADAQVYYVPTVSTARYPLKAKWRARWDEQLCDSEQGMAAFAVRGAALLDPECNTPPACHGRSPFRGLAIDLPIVKFRDPVKPQEEPAAAFRRDWVTHTAPFGDALSAPIQFRHTRYLGNRDSEPRVATAHRIRLARGTSEFVLINVHLTTLTSEDGKRLGEDSPDALRRTHRVPTHEAEFVRHLQLAEISDFIWHVYTDESLRLPVVVVGDFNTTPDRPDLRAFMDAAALTPVFTSEKCWSCNGPPLPQGRYFYTSNRFKSVLTDEAAAFEQLTGEKAKGLLVTEVCAVCGKLLFTHKRNFKLIDNIMYTRGHPPGRSLKATIELDESQENAGIGTQTHFSDHYPIWAVFRFA